MASRDLLCEAIRVAQEASKCPGRHDERFLLELLNEVATRVRSELGPYFTGCTVCRWEVVLYSLLSRAGMVSEGEESVYAEKGVEKEE